MKQLVMQATKLVMQARKEASTNSDCVFVAKTTSYKHEFKILWVGKYNISGTSDTNYSPPFICEVTQNFQKSTINSQIKINLKIFLYI